MTNKEALKAQINYPVREDSIDLALLNAGVSPETTYVPATHQKGVETALAGLIFILVTSPKSESELDYSLTSQDIDQLLALRSVILKRWDLTDEFANTGAVIKDGTANWGSSNYC
jgi:hypothetical protein